MTTGASSEEEEHQDSSNESGNETESSTEFKKPVHYKKEMRKATKGKKKGQEVIHFICSYCKDSFQGPSSSSCLKHLRSRHPKKCSELLEADSNQKQKDSATKFFFNTKMKQTFNTDVFLGKLLTWIVRSDQPFSIVDDEDFKEMMTYLKPNLSILSRTTLMRRLDHIYNYKKDELKRRLHSFASKFSVTCDVWTSKNQMSFFGITLHYIDNDWNVQNGLLAFKFLEEEHDGKSLAGAMLSVLDDFEITSRLLGVTVDNASNNTTMMREMQAVFDLRHPEAGFSAGWNKMECLAHVVNLAAGEILKCFSNSDDNLSNTETASHEDRIISSISRLSFIVRKIRDSPKKRREMKRQCEQKGVDFLVPIIDVKTRWNSTYDMLQRALELKVIIEETVYASKDHILIGKVLCDEDWKCIKELIDILEPLKEVTLMGSRGKDTISIYEVLPMYHFCIHMIQESAEKLNPGHAMHVGLKNACDKLIRYYDDLSPLAGIALILNPTMKKEFLKNNLEWEDHWVDSVMTCFNDAYNYYEKKSRTFDLTGSSSSSALVVEPATRKSAVHEKYENFLKRKREEAETSTVTIEDERTRYFDAAKVPLKSNVLEYWKLNCHNYPILSAMARDYLTVQATSVPSERAFSSGTDLVTANRSSLAGNTVEKTQFLKFNLQ